MHKGSLLSASTPAFTICRLFSDSRSDMCEWYLFALAGISLIISSVEHLFICLLPNSMRVWKSTYSGLLPLFFWIRLFVCVILDYMSCFCFCILDISFLSVISFANIFSHSVGQHACWGGPMKALSALPWGQVRVFAPHEWGPDCPQPPGGLSGPPVWPRGWPLPCRTPGTGTPSLCLAAPSPAECASVIKPVWFPSHPRGSHSYLITFLPFLPDSCGFSVQPWLYRSLSASLQLIFSENCSTFRCLLMCLCGEVSFTSSYCTILTDMSICSTF